MECYFEVLIMNEVTFIERMHLADINAGCTKNNEIRKITDFYKFSKWVE